MDINIKHIGSNYLPAFFGSEIPALSRLLPIAVVFTFALFASACSDGDSSVGLAKNEMAPTLMNKKSSHKPSRKLATAGNYQFIYKINAAQFGGRTVRWASKSINVSGITNPSWQAAIRKWPVVRFKFDSSKEIVFAGYSDEYPKACGWAQPMWRSNGKMARCIIKLNTAIDSMGCHSTELVLQHEVGHCLGIMGHTNDGGLMDPVCCSSKITSRVRRGLALLYALKPGTKIRSKARARAGSTMHNKSKAVQDDLFDPSGERLIYGPVIATQAKQ